MAAEQQFPILSKVNNHFDSQISNQFLGAGPGTLRLPRIESYITRESMY